MRKLFLFWVLWAACWVLIIELMIGFNLTPYQPLGGIIIGAVFDIIAAVFFVRYRLFMYIGVIIFSMVLIFSFSFVLLVCYLLSMALLVVTYYALKWIHSMSGRGTFLANFERSKSLKCLCRLRLKECVIHKTPKIWYNNKWCTKVHRKRPRERRVEWQMMYVQRWKCREPWRNSEFPQSTSSWPVGEVISTPRR